MDFLKDGLEKQSLQNDTKKNYIKIKPNFTEFISRSQWGFDKYEIQNTSNAWHRQKQGLYLYLQAL